MHETLFYKKFYKKFISSYILYDLFKFRKSLIEAIYSFVFLSFFLNDTGLLEGHTNALLAVIILNNKVNSTST